MGIPNSRRHPGRSRSASSLGCSRTRKQQYKKKRITIFFDSQEVIRACKVHLAVSPTVLKILKAAITKLKKKNATILLRWIPGHMGIKGNEIANKVAKEYSRSLLSDRPGQSQRDHPYSTVLKSLSKEYDPITTINKAKKQLQ